MFRRLTNNTVKTIGIRKFSNDNNNHRIVEELVKIRRTLERIVICGFCLNFILAIKR
jgi:hypothetical protein